MTAPTSDDEKPLMAHDLTFCARCGAEAIAWAPGPLGKPEGRCAAHHVPAFVSVPSPDAERALDLDEHERATSAIDHALRAARWDVDDLVTNHFGDRVWLKALVVDGKRVGITDCCFESEPCDHHAAIDLARKDN